MFVLTVTCDSAEFDVPIICSAESLEECADMAREYLPEGAKEDWQKIRKALMAKKSWADEATQTRFTIRGTTSRR